MRSLGAAAQTVLPGILANYTDVLLGWDGELPEVESPLAASYSSVRVRSQLRHSFIHFVDGHVFSAP